MIRGSWICSECQGQECQDQLTSTRRIIRRFVRGVLHKRNTEPSMMQGRGEGIVLQFVHLRKDKTCSPPAVPQEIALADGQILIGGQLLIKLMTGQGGNQLAEGCSGFCSRLEQVRDFDSKLGSQLKTIDEGDEKIHNGNGIVTFPSSRMMSTFIDERMSRFAQVSGGFEHKVRVMDLDQTGGDL
ncbi:hypothetical protein Bca4012_066054 [Brassica carinata]